MIFAQGQSTFLQKKGQPFPLWVRQLREQVLGNIPFPGSHCGLTVAFLGIPLVLQGPPPAGRRSLLLSPPIHVQIPGAPQFDHPLVGLAPPKLRLDYDSRWGKPLFKDHLADACQFAAVPDRQCTVRERTPAASA